MMLFTCGLLFAIVCALIWMLRDDTRCIDLMAKDLLQAKDELCKRIPAPVKVMVDREMSEKELLECFAGTTLDTPLLRGMLRLLRRAEDAALESAMMGRDKDETAECVAQVEALKGVQADLVRTVEYVRDGKK